MKIIGLMLTWNNLEFFKCSLHQALNFCDEVYVVDGCHFHKYPWHSTDGTYEYIKNYRHPKLRLVDIRKKRNRYDKVQRFLRETIPKKSQYWKPGNWVFQLDDDLFFFEKDLIRIREAMQNSEYPALTCDVRYFIYNFKLNFLQKGGSVCYRILDEFGMKYAGRPCYKNGVGFKALYLKDIIAHHYTYMKKPARMKARWEMSIEKGANSSIGRFQKWMNIDLNKIDFAQLKEELNRIRPDGGLNIYTGKYPKVLDNHPWMNIDDIRRLR